MDAVGSKRKRIIIVGASETGISLARMLCTTFEVAVLESNPARLDLLRGLLVAQLGCRGGVAGRYLGRGGVGIGRAQIGRLLLERPDVGHYLVAARHRCQCLPDQPLRQGGVELHEIGNSRSVLGRFRIATCLCGIGPFPEQLLGQPRCPRAESRVDLANVLELGLLLRTLRHKVLI